MLGEANMTLNEFVNLVGNQIPWERYNWDGELLSFDDTPTTDFNPEDLKNVFAADNDGGGWDGFAAAIVQLKDGRWVAWESFWGPTGSGFCCDAYGGDSNIYFAKTLLDAAKFGLSESARNLLNINLEKIDENRIQPIT